MTEVVGPKPFRWKTLVAVFALTVVASCGQALSPVSAGAFQPDCVNWWECDSPPGGDDSWKNIGWVAASADSVMATPPPPAQSPPGQGYGDGYRPALPTARSGLPSLRQAANSAWQRMKLAYRRAECRRLRAKIKLHIESLYGDDADFDEVVNSGDRELDQLQHDWQDEGCADVKR